MSTVSLPDQELLDRVRAGDSGAFEILFRTYYPALLRFARAQLRQSQDAEDVVHDVFLRIWADPASIGGDRSLTAYLLAAVRHRVIDLTRHREVVKKVIVASVDEPRSASDHVGVYEIRPSAPASDAAALAELDEAIRRSVATLPERCRTAFLLCRDQDLSYAEAAEVMGVSPATVKTQMARALASLRVSLEPYLGVLLAISSIMR